MNTRCRGKKDRRISFQETSGEGRVEEAVCEREAGGDDLRERTSRRRALRKRGVEDTA